MNESNIEDNKNSKKNIREIYLKAVNNNKGNVTNYHKNEMDGTQTKIKNLLKDFFGKTKKKGFLICKTKTLVTTLVLILKKNTISLSELLKIQKN